jgi:hypothetical protein
LATQKVVTVWLEDTMDRSSLTRPSYWELELKLFSQKAGGGAGQSVIDVRLSIANVDFTISKSYLWGTVQLPGTGYRQEWAQCGWAQGGRFDPRLPELGTWTINSQGTMELSGAGITHFRLFHVDVNERWGEASYLGSASSSNQLSGHGKWNWLGISDLQKFPGYKLDDSFIVNELTRRDGMMERILKFAYTTDGTPRSGTGCENLLGYKDFLGSLDSVLFTFTNPNYFRHRLVEWRGLCMKGWELNYYFIGFGFASLDFSWASCSGFIRTWKLLCYQSTPSEGCMKAAYAGFLEMGKNWTTHGRAVATRMRMDAMDQERLLKRFRKSRSGG